MFKNFHMLKQFKHKYKKNRIIIQSFKHKQIIDLITSFQSDISKLIQFIYKLMFCKHFNMKILLLKKMLINDNIMLHSLILSNNTYFFINQLYAFNFLFFYNYVDNINQRIKTNSYYSKFFFFISLYNHDVKLILFDLFYCLYFYLLFFFFFITSTIFLFSISFNFASLPNKLTKYTVLRSPHTNKKSREQFELKTYKKMFCYPSYFYSYYNYLFINKHNSFFCNITHLLNTYKYGKF